MSISVNHHLEYSRAAYGRLRVNISASNGAVLKVVGLRLAQSLGYLSVKFSFLSGNVRILVHNSNCTLSKTLST